MGALLNELNELLDGRDQADTSPPGMSVSGGADLSLGAGSRWPAGGSAFEAHDQAAPLARGAFVRYTSRGVYPLPPAIGRNLPFEAQEVKSFLLGCVRSLPRTQREYLPNRTPPPNCG